MKRLFYLLFILSLVYSGCTPDNISLEGVWEVRSIYSVDEDTLIEDSEMFEGIKFNFCSNGVLYILTEDIFDNVNWTLDGNTLSLANKEENLNFYVEADGLSLEVTGEYVELGEFSATLVQVGAEQQYETFLVKNNYLNGHSEPSIGIAFDSFLRNPEWEAFIGTDDVRFLNVSGEVSLFNNVVEVLIQFQVDSINKSYSICAMELNGEPQNNYVINSMINKIYGKEMSEADFYNPKPQLPAAPLNIYIFQNISESIQRLAAKRGNEFEGKETIDRLKLSKEIVEEAFKINNYSYAATIKKVANDGFSTSEIQMTQIILIPVFNCENDEEVKAIYTAEELKGINEIIRMVEVYKGY